MHGRAETATEPAQTSMPDGQLARLAARDQHAFGILFDRYWEPIFRYCSFRVENWHEAEDLASQVFVRAFDGIGRFNSADNPNGFRAWLFAIARYVVIDAHRYRARHPQTELEAVAAIATDAAPLDDQLVAADQQQLLARLLRHLNPDQRDLMELRLADLSAGEIGQVLGKSPEAVRTAQSRAIQALKQAVSIECADGGCDFHG